MSMLGLSTYFWGVGIVKLCVPCNSLQRYEWLCAYVGERVVIRYNMGFVMRCNS